eukprot:5305198-Prymnesium_polylepis.3
MDGAEARRGAGVRASAAARHGRDEPWGHRAHRRRGRRASEVNFLVPISGEILVRSISDLHSRTLPGAGRKSAASASNGAFPDAREREVYQKSASDSLLEETRE